ncbi:TnsA-like heteromeric transposase endonuclease subunit [Kitasatospora sp. NPDC097643]|uniref:TnsA-like heteromeric transposase endonuclease subunit n=1 Tax=Kitasatospora sp. NPDC097643 TaxID=3157230 RepID=UPI00332C99C5
MPDCGAGRPGDAAPLWTVRRCVAAETVRPVSSAENCRGVAELVTARPDSARGQQERSGPLGQSSGRTRDSHVGCDIAGPRDAARLRPVRDRVRFADVLAVLARETTRRGRSHAPDYFAWAVDGTGLVVDCQPVDRIDDRSAAAFTVTRQVCEAVGWAYRLVGALDPVRVANLRWLAGYRHPRHAAAEPGRSAAARPGGGARGRA